ncbi:hypothetical protein PVAP13_3KG292154 [Panicum virgatum]|uniref:Uncharacterized protein n=1 Tax=Panicum virgatum TaxID=38727 RepID=A0A8T0UUZ7_PANVG|nr:hypothetical protein PVAP13_3KG292154 [Panicum virgatum]
MSVPSKPGLRQRKVAQRVNPITSACPSSHLRKSYPLRLRLRHSPCCLQTCSLASTATGNALPAAGGIPRAAARPRRGRSWPAAARASDSESPPRGSYKRRQGLSAELACCRLARLLPTPLEELSAGLLPALLDGGGRGCSSTWFSPVPPRGACPPTPRSRLLHAPPAGAHPLPPRACPPPRPPPGRACLR